MTTLDASPVSGGRLPEGKSPDATGRSNGLGGRLPGGQSTRPTIQEQILELEKEIRDRAQRRYPYAVKSGRLLPETAEAKLAAMRAAHDTLIWLEKNQGWIRAEANRRAARAALADHPAVTTVLEAFPGAEIEED